jgi:hypothetical protein
VACSTKEAYYNYYGIGKKIETRLHVISFLKKMLALFFH